MFYDGDVTFVGAYCHTPLLGLDSTKNESTAYWKEKYIALLEKYNALLERVSK